MTVYFNTYFKYRYM